MTARSALMQVGVRAILVGARSQGKPLSPIDSWEKRAISALTGLHCKTKPHSTEVDSVPTSQCKRDVVSVRERLLRERHPTAKTLLTIRKEKQVLSRARQVARSKEARSKDDLRDEARWTSHS